MGFALWQKKNTFANTTPTPFSRSGARCGDCRHAIPFESPIISSINILHSPRIMGRQRMAEREGFEPSVPLPAHCFSRAAPSTTRTPLHNYIILDSNLEDFDPPPAGPSQHLCKTSLQELAPLRNATGISHLGTLLHTCFRNKPIQPLLHLSMVTL